MGDPYYSTSSSNQFLGSSNYDMPAEGRRSHQIFSFNPAIGQSSQQQRNTVQDKRDIDRIMQRYSNPQGQDKPFFQSSNLASQQFGQQSNYDQNQNQTPSGGGPVNFVDSQHFDDQEQKHQINQKYQVNYPNLLDDDTSLMTSLNQSRQNDTQAFNGVINPFMKNFDNSIRTDADDISPNNYDKFHQFEKLDLNQIANSMKQSSNQERVTFGFNNANIFELRQSQMNNNNNNNNQGGQQSVTQNNQINYSLGGGRESTHSIASLQSSQQPQQQVSNSNFQFFNSPVGNQSNYSQNFAQSVSGQFGQNQQSGQFGGQSKVEEVIQNDDNMILKDINNDDLDNNIFGDDDDDDLTKQEEQEQRVNQMHAEISVLNDQVHKMLQTYKNQLDKQSDKKLVKQKVKQDASLLSKNYREIIGKFDDLSQNNDVSQISISSRSNMSSFAGYSLLRGNTKKEKEINVMMNLVEQFLCKFDEDFQNQSVSRQASNQQQSNSVKSQNKVQDDKYQQLLRNQKQSNIYSDFEKLSINQHQQEQSNQPKLAQQYQLQNQQNPQPKPSIQVQQPQQIQQQYQQQQQQYQQQQQQQQYQQQQQQFPQINLVVTPPTTNRNSQFINSPSVNEQRNTQEMRQNPSIQNSPSQQARQFNPQQDMNVQYAKMPSGIISNQSSSHSTSTSASQQGMPVEMDKIVIQHKKDHQDNPFNSSIQSPASIQNTSISQGNTPVGYQQQQFFFNNNVLSPITQQQKPFEGEEAVKRTQLPALRHVSSAQPQLGLPPVQSSLPSSAANTPISNQIYSQSTRTSGVNQFNFNTISAGPTLTNVNANTNTNAYDIPTYNVNTLAPPQTNTLNPPGFSYSQPNSLSNIPQFSRSPSLNPTPPTGSTGSMTLNVPGQNSYNQITTQNNNQQNTRDSNIFDIHDQLDLYCTNCDQYFKVAIYFDHVKICDKDHAHKMNSASLDDTFYNLEQSTAVMNKLDQKIDKISRNLSNALQLQKLPTTRDILSETIRDLADTLKSENAQTVKKIIKKIEQNTRQMDAQSGNLPQSSSYKLYLYLKRVTNILREKETALEQSAMLKEISMIYPINKANNNNNTTNNNNTNNNNNNNNLTTNIHPITAQLQQQAQQNFYAPRFSHQPNSNIVNFNNNFTRNTLSTNSELEKKSKFYDLAGEIKNRLPPNHFGSSYLISELYEDAKGIPENQWQQFLLNKFQLSS